MESLEYLVYENKGIVVCKLWDCKDLAIKCIKKYGGLECKTDKYAIENIFTGIAKCSPEDEFDLEYGKRLALDRAKAKRSKAIKDGIRRYITDIKGQIYRLESAL